jgi:hypothetical protein
MKTPALPPIDPRIRLRLAVERYHRLVAMRAPQFILDKEKKRIFERLIAFRN